MDHTPNSLAHISNAELLAEVERRYLPNPGKPFPLEMFSFLNKCRPAITIEIIAFRPGADGAEVLILQRDPAEVGYAGKSHLPGGYMFIDETIEDCIQRMAGREIGVGVASFQYVGALFDHYEERGHHVHHSFAAELSGEPTKGEWTHPDQLPENFVPHHRPIVRAAFDVQSGAAAPGWFLEYEPEAKR